MRVTKEEMAKNNAKIIVQAARLFREKGIEATSVAEVMGAADLTHGGFYRHFKSKDELVVAAIKYAIDYILKSLAQDIENKGAKNAVALYIDKYLSEDHVEDPGSGCPIASLSAEVTRLSDTIQNALSLSLQQLVTLLMQTQEGTKDEQHTQALKLLASLLGILTLARSTQQGKARQEILHTGKLLTKVK